MYRNRRQLRAFQRSVLKRKVDHSRLRVSRMISELLVQVALLPHPLLLVLV